MAEKLKTGDMIGIISPCYAAEENHYDKSIGVLEAKGFKVKKSKNLSKNTYGYSATEQERASDFNDMISDKEVKMVLFGGGWVG